MLLLAFVARVMWKKLAPGTGFLDGFGALLERPEHGRPGPVKRLAGTDFVGGEFQGHPVAVLVQSKRGERRGYVIVGMATNSTEQWQLGKRASAGDLAHAITALVSPATRIEDQGDLQLTIDGDSSAARQWMTRPEVRQALHALVLLHGISLSLEGGWLRARWMPGGPLVFPGRFDAHKWREVLAYMHALTLSLEPSRAARPAQSTVNPRGATSLHA